jgi:hypothetical protein
MLWLHSRAHHHSFFRVFCFVFRFLPISLFPVPPSPLSLTRALHQFQDLSGQWRNIGIHDTLLSLLTVSVSFFLKEMETDTLLNMRTNIEHFFLLSLLLLFVFVHFKFICFHF